MATPRDNLALSITSKEGVPSALKSPKGSSAGGKHIHFEDTPRFSTANITSPGSSSKHHSPGGSSVVVTNTIIPTPGVLATKLNEIHKMIDACPDIAPAVKKDCTALLLSADRGLIETTNARAVAIRKKKEEEEALRASTPREVIVPSAALKGARPTAKKATTTTPPKAQEEPAEQAEPTEEEKRIATNRKKAQAKVEASWKHFVKLMSKTMSEQEVELLSLKTIKELMHFHQLDRTPLEVANIELFWRKLAQKREDERNQKALMHKTCGAAPQDKTAPTRIISKSMDKSKKR